MTGHDAVEAFRQTRYALILMDYRLPDLDGCAVTRLIRSIEREQHPPYRVPIIGLTACIDPAVLNRCVRAGMDRCFRKPLDGTILRELELFLDPQGRASRPAPALQTVPPYAPSGSVPARTR